MMKTKSLNLLILIVGMALFAGCSKDDGVSPDDPNALRTIKLTVKTDSYNYGYISFGLSNNDYSYENIPFPTDLFIDWGDGSTTSSDSHEYSTSGTYNVTIQAKNLKWFESDRGEVQQIDVKECNSLVYLGLWGQELTTLDVAGLTALKYLNCGSNDLTFLDIKGCSSLRRLDCLANELSAEVLNQIFKDLPQAEVWTDKYGDKNQSRIDFDGNPGSEDCDISILEKKGWEIY